MIYFNQLSSIIEMIEVHLYGKLRSLVPKSKPDEDTVLLSDYKHDEIFSEFIQRIGLKESDLGDCFINGSLANMDDVLKDGDRVALFPFNMVLLCGGQHLKVNRSNKGNNKIDYY